MVCTLKWGTANGVANKCFCIYGDPAAPTNLKVKVQAKVQALSAKAGLPSLRGERVKKTLVLTCEATSFIL